jgi:chromate transporter
VVAAAAGVGWLLGRLAPHTLTSKAKAGHDAGGPPPLIPDHVLHAERPSLAHTFRILESRTGIRIRRLAWLVRVGGR